jgi:hypothetical protein
MAAVRTPYTLDNLPNGFRYDATKNSIYTPAFREFCILNPDNSVNCPPLTYESVDDFVGTHLSIINHRQDVKEGTVKERDVTSEFFRSRFVTIKCLDCTIDREKLVILSICLIVLFIAALCIPITCYTWPNGVLG